MLIVGNYVWICAVTVVTVVWVNNWYVVMKTQATEMYSGVSMVAFPKCFTCCFITLYCFLGIMIS